MISRFKDWFGIEGVKITLDIPESVPAGQNALHGVVVFSSLREQRVHNITFKFSEKYQRGRGNDKRIDDHILARDVRNVNLLIKANEAYYYPFRLPFEIVESAMDKYAKKPLLKPIVNTLKWTNAVKSEYFLDVSAEVDGTRLSPHVKKKINLIT